ncbi:hypothetical protein M422DRAFT_255993 [Sphaerobolus stellatus SS14]|uniref:Uncharacterized protein n=1 Tax=Sphaerobolus stellatus (strain SS14) TaxID=990650 RepID=A0A0C9VSU1_SPHS4|nr:hypothetical protein M422DRAFT_255993 [Sphaerobolus stellatus SS14]
MVADYAPRGILPCCLKRSGALPLEVYLHTKDSSNEFSNEIHWQETLQILDRNFNRIRVFRLDSCSNIVLATLFPPHTIRDALALRSLIITRPHPTDVKFGRIRPDNLREVTSFTPGSSFSPSYASSMLQNLVIFNPGIEKIAGQAINGHRALQDFFSTYKSIKTCLIYYSSDNEAEKMFRRRNDHTLFDSRLEDLTIICQHSGPIGLENRLDLIKGLRTSSFMSIDIGFGCTTGYITAVPEYYSLLMLRISTTWFTKIQPSLQKLRFSGRKITAEREMPLRELLGAVPSISTLEFLLVKMPAIFGVLVLKILALCLPLWNIWCWIYGP